MGSGVGALEGNVLGSKFQFIKVQLEKWIGLFVGLSDGDVVGYIIGRLEGLNVHLWVLRVWGG